MPVNGALRFAWIWIPILALLFGVLAGAPVSRGDLKPATENAVDEWDGEVMTSTAPDPPPQKRVDEWDSEVIK